jgi:hypothetical protein
MFLLFLLSLVQAQTFCTTHRHCCLFSEQRQNNTAFRIHVYHSKVGWCGIGLGSSMNSATVYVQIFNFMTRYLGFIMDSQYFLNVLVVKKLNQPSFLIQILTLLSNSGMVLIGTLHLSFQILLLKNSQ